MTSNADRRLLLTLAREAIRAHVAARPAPTVPGAGAALRPGAAFVTLHHAGALRGCVGHLDADRPLGAVVVACAIAAATDDPRFPPVTASEADGLDVELSLLGALEPVAALDEIVVGRHGLVVESGWRRGLLLPQVAVEWRWTVAAFVEHTCRKAGLPPGAWPAGGAALWKFEAEVFGDADVEEGDAPSEATHQ